MIDLKIGAIVHINSDNTAVQKEGEAGQEYRPPDLVYADPERHERFVEEMFRIMRS